MKNLIKNTKNLGSLIFFFLFLIIFSPTVYAAPSFYDGPITVGGQPLEGVEPLTSLQLSQGNYYGYNSYMFKGQPIIRANSKITLSSL